MSEIRIHQIVTLTRDLAMQPRERLNKEAVKEYAEAFKAGAEPDPIGVVTDGETLWVWDGFHRIAAFEELGRRSINCYVTEGNRLDAIRLSLGANAAHGMRRTSEEKRRAILRALSVPEWADKSARTIAEWCAVDHKTVTNVKNQLGKFPSSGDGKLVGKDGKRRPANRPVQTNDSLTISDADRDVIDRQHDGGLTPEQIAEDTGVPLEIVQETIAEHGQERTEDIARLMQGGVVDAKINDKGEPEFTFSIPDIKPVLSAFKALEVEYKNQHKLLLMMPGDAISLYGQMHGNFRAINKHLNQLKRRLEDLKKIPTTPEVSK